MGGVIMEKYQIVMVNEKTEEIVRGKVFDTNKDACFQERIMNNLTDFNGFEQFAYHVYTVEVTP